MKAFLLAAGLGTRLRPLTDITPKCLVPIRGKPLLAWWLELLEENGVTQVLLNTHHLAEQVHRFITASNRRRGIQVTEAYEPVLLGSGGTLAANRGFIGADDSFLICNADTLTNLCLSKLVEYHKEHHGVLTMALFRSNTPQQCGIVGLEDGGRIISFTEKPERPAGNLANAGIYVAQRALFEHIPEQPFCDLGKDVLPRLTGSMYGYETQEYLIDVGTPEHLRKARMEWQYDHLKNTAENWVRRRGHGY